MRWYRAQIDGSWHRCPKEKPCGYAPMLGLKPWTGSAAVAVVLLLSFLADLGRQGGKDWGKQASNNGTRDPSTDQCRVHSWQLHRSVFTFSNRNIGTICVMYRKSETGMWTFGKVEKRGHTWGNGELSFSVWRPFTPQCAQTHTTCFSINCENEKNISSDVTLSGCLVSECVCQHKCVPQSMWWSDDVQ